MVLQEGGNVPLCITPQERVVMKFSQCDEPLVKDKTYDELLNNLKIIGMGISIVKGKRLDYMQYITHKN